MTPSRHEIRVGYIDQETDDAPCIECGIQSAVYLLDHDDGMWFTCFAHTGLVALRLLRGELEGVRPSLPPVHRMISAEYCGEVSVVTWAYELADDKLARPLPRRWQHVQGVARQARRLGELDQAEFETLEAAALLHDIGYAPDLVDTGFHPLDGARYLESIAAPKRLVDLVAHHSAARQDAEVLGLADYLDAYEDEQSAVRDALWWADMTTGPDGQVMTFTERMDEVRARYGPDHPVSQAIERSWDIRQAAVDRTEALLRGLPDY